MGTELSHEVSVEFDADDASDHWWREGQRALQDAVADARGDPAITVMQAPLPPSENGDTPRGFFVDALLSVTIDALGSLLAQLVTHLALLSRRPQTIQLRAEPRDSSPSSLSSSPASSDTTSTLNIDIAEFARELTDQPADEVSSQQLDDIPTEQRIQRWVAISISDVQRVVIRIRIQ